MSGDAPQDAPWHAHVYAGPGEEARAEALRATFQAMDAVLFTGDLTTGKAGPHPIPQFEIHFLERDLDVVRPVLKAAGLRALVHPLTDDDLADHTRLGQWIGEPLDLDLTTLDPPGVNQGLARFGKTDF